MSDKPHRFLNVNARTLSPRRREPARKAASANPASLLDAGPFISLARPTATPTGGV